jgi:hypothetical protein
MRWREEVGEFEKHLEREFAELLLGKASKEDRCDLHPHVRGQEVQFYERIYLVPALCVRFPNPGDHRLGRRGRDKRRGDLRGESVRPVATDTLKLSGTLTKQIPIERSSLRHGVHDTMHNATAKLYRPLGPDGIEVKVVESSEHLTAGDPPAEYMPRRGPSVLIIRGLETIPLAIRAHEGASMLELGNDLRIEQRFDRNIVMSRQLHPSFLDAKTPSSFARSE